jgi:hypothetical protein
MSPSFTRLCGLALTCIVAGGLALAAPAGAAGHPKSTAGLHPSVGGVPMHRSSGVSPKVTPTTDFGAGYFAYPVDSGQGLASVSATFTVPSITCVHSADHEWLLPGIWVYAAGAITQQVDVNLNCNLGAQLLQDVICIGGSPCDQSLTVAPGDKIVTSLAYTATHTIGTVRDITAGTSAQVVSDPITTDEVILVGDQGPSQFSVTKVPQFTTVKFTSVQVNGQYLEDAPFPTRYNLKTATALQIAAGPIQSDGQSFTTTFKHS